jgi:hypothetical protein
MKVSGLLELCLKMKFKFKQKMFYWETDKIIFTELVKEPTSCGDVRASLANLDILLA